MVAGMVEETVVMVEEEVVEEAVAGVVEEVTEEGVVAGAVVEIEVVDQLLILPGEGDKGLQRDDPHPRRITMRMLIMPPERHQREILITMITMPLRLGLQGIHMVLHRREGLLLTRMLLIRMQPRRPGDTLRLLLPVRLPEIRIMMIPTMLPARMQPLHLPGQLQNQIRMQPTLMREHHHPRQILMQQLLEQTHMLAPTHMEDLRPLQRVLLTLELLLKIHMLRILMPEIRTREPLQIPMLQIRMRGLPL